MSLRAAQKHAVLSVSLSDWLGGNMWLDHNISGESFKSHPTFLLNGDSDMPSLAGFDVVNRSGFASVSAANYTTKSAVF